MNNLDKAIAFAVTKHGGTYRKRERGGIQLPYIVHPLEVLKQLWVWEAITETISIGAVLHDTIEDTEATYGAILNEFGTNVARLVSELTHVTDGSKEVYLKSFRTKSINSLVIKLADRICNVKDFFITDPNYARVYFDKALSLFECARDRRVEIEKEFGEKPADNIFYSISTAREFVYER